ncbi:MAG: hypothetical protein IJI14_08195 [Anaerolineaceae bacterium]|nr:hypothetical protein [Anaerolineaceae bacterium]
MGRRDIYGEERKRRIIKFIKDYKEQNGFSPSIKNISDSLNLNSTSLVLFYLKNLEQKGYITRNKNISRSICLLRDEYNG